MQRKILLSNSERSALHVHVVVYLLCRRSKEKPARRNSLSSPGSSLIRAKRLAWDAPKQPLPEAEPASGIRWDGDSVAVPAASLAESIAPRADGRDTGAALFASLPRSEAISARRSSDTHRRTSQSAGFFWGGLFGRAKDKGMDLTATDMEACKLPGALAAWELQRPIRKPLLWARAAMYLTAHQRQVSWLRLLVLAPELQRLGELDVCIACYACRRRA